MSRGFCLSRYLILYLSVSLSLFLSCSPSDSPHLWDFNSSLPVMRCLLSSVDFRWSCPVFGPVKADECTLPVTCYLIPWTPVYLALFLRLPVYPVASVSLSVFALSKLVTLDFRWWTHSICHLFPYYTFNTCLSLPSCLPSDFCVHVCLHSVKISYVRPQLMNVLYLSSVSLYFEHLSILHCPLLPVYLVLVLVYL